MWSAPPDVLRSFEAESEAKSGEGNGNGNARQTRAQTFKSSYRLRHIVRIVRTGALNHDSRIT